MPSFAIDARLVLTACIVGFAREQHGGGSLVAAGERARPRLQEGKPLRKLDCRSGRYWNNHRPVWRGPEVGCRRHRGAHQGIECRLRGTSHLAVVQNCVIQICISAPGKNRSFCLLLRRQVETLGRAASPNAAHARLSAFGRNAR
jgi:hypothetical protein